MRILSSIFNALSSLKTGRTRTAEPLKPATASGCDEPTSRCQTVSSIWTLRNHQPVIPRVPFIRWAMNFPHKFTGSLWPTFIPVRFVNLTVKRTYTITLYNKNLFEFAFVHLRYFLGGDRPSQTISRRLSSSINNKLSKIKNLEWYFTTVYTPTYSTQSI